MDRPRADSMSHTATGGKASSPYAPGVLEEAGPVLSGAGKPCTVGLVPSHTSGTEVVGVMTLSGES